MLLSQRETQSISKQLLFREGGEEEELFLPGLASALAHPPGACPLAPGMDRASSSGRSVVVAV